MYFILYYGKKPMVTYQDIKSKPYLKQMLRYVEERACPTTLFFGNLGFYNYLKSLYVNLQNQGYRTAL